MSLLDPAERSARGLALQAEVTGQPPPGPPRCSMNPGAISSMPRCGIAPVSIGGRAT